MSGGLLFFETSLLLVVPMPERAKTKGSQVKFQTVFQDIWCNVEARCLAFVWRTRFRLVGATSHTQITNKSFFWQAVAQKKYDNAHSNQRKRKAAHKSATTSTVAAEKNTDAKQQSWLERPILIQCEDSYSVNCASMSWLFSQLCARFLWLPDPWHMIHNVGLNSVKEAGYFASVALTSSAMDVSWGPWGTEKWFRTISDGMQEFFAHALPDSAEPTEIDPLVAAILPRVAQERNWDICQCGPADIRAALSHSNFLKSKGQKSQISRWWVWHKRFAKWIGEKSDPTLDYVFEDLSDVDAEWSLRLIPLVYIGIRLGYIHSAGGKQILKPLAALQDMGGGDEGKDMKSTKEQQQRVRDSCRNALHIATVSCSEAGSLAHQFVCSSIYGVMCAFLRSSKLQQNDWLRKAVGYYLQFRKNSWVVCVQCLLSVPLNQHCVLQAKVVHGDLSIRTDAMTVLFMQTELRRWYSHHRRHLKSRQACFDFYLHMADGSNTLAHVLQIGQLTDMQLSKAGVLVNLAGNEAFAKLSVNDPVVAVQDALMKRMFSLRFSVQKLRLQGLCLFMFAYPWKLVLLAHPDPEAWLVKLIGVFRSGFIHFVGSETKLPKTTVSMQASLTFWCLKLHNFTMTPNSHHFLQIIFLIINVKRESGKEWLFFNIECFLPTRNSRLCPNCSSHCWCQVRNQVKKDLIAHGKLLSKMEKRTDSFWRKFLHRTVLTTTLTDEVLKTLLQNSETDCTQLTQIIKRIFSNIGHSGIVEDGFQRMRSKENTSEGGSKVAANRLWKIPSDANLLTEVYNFQEVDPKVIPEQKQESLPSTFYRPCASDATVPLEDVPGTSQNPHWPSFSPPFLQYSEDLGLLEALHDKPEAAYAIWRTVFLQPHLVCRNKKLHDVSDRFLCFGSSNMHNCNLLWPLKKSTLQLKKKEFVMWQMKDISKPSELKWLPVVDFNDWLITPTRYISPIHAFCENKNQTPSSSVSGLITQCGQETPLLRYAAQNGFWNVNLQTLKKLCKEPWIKSRLQNSLCVFCFLIVILEYHRPH